MNTQWWGKFEIPGETWCKWQINQLSLYVWHTDVEWRFAWVREKEIVPETEAYRFQNEGITLPEPADLEHARFVIGGNQGEVELRLQLADRPMIARPEVPMFVPIGESATLFVSTGIWIQLVISDKVLLDIPVYRPSDTWFGQNTREGELCYFSLTRARTERSLVTKDAHRATTPITVINQCDEMLRIERLRVPTPYLSLFVNEEGELLTDALEYKLEKNRIESVVSIDSHESIKAYRSLNRPREQGDHNFFTEAISKIFG
ncbi:MAG: hypothetical protein NPIRA05_19500 [Nitrospirales bacterium]|nr:MAG: hypothetical protein NPIRA05_19500 [Nitrospirales bacterium]